MSTLPLVSVDQIADWRSPDPHVSKSVRSVWLLTGAMDEQGALIELPDAPHATTGYKPRGGRPRVKGCRTTSVNLSLEERELLERLAGADNASLNDVWRRALRAYAAQRGLLDQQEVRPAA